MVIFRHQDKLPFLIYFFYLVEGGEQKEGGVTVEEIRGDLRKMDEYWPPRDHADPGPEPPKATGYLMK